jgi:hypothetical protein
MVHRPSEMARNIDIGHSGGDKIERKEAGSPRASILETLVGW